MVEIFRQSGHKKPLKEIILKIKHEKYVRTLVARSRKRMLQAEEL